MSQRTIHVPTEDGGICAITFDRSQGDGWWVVAISDELIDLAPEGLTAALGMAIMQMKNERVGRSSR